NEGTDDDCTCALCDGRLRHIGAGDRRADRLDSARQPVAAARDGRAGGWRPAPPCRPQGRILMADQTVTPGPRRLLVFLPVIIFLGLAALFLIQLTSGRDIAEIPSALIGQPA